MLTLVLFYVIAFIVLLGAFKMVSSTNLVHSALFMALTFIGIAFVYILLAADYLAVVQILVYVGAISVLFVFGVMLTRRETMEKSNVLNRYKVSAGIAALAFFVLIGRIIFLTKFTPMGSSSPDSIVKGISTLFMGDFAIPFEVTGLLLLVAMVGAIIIGKGVNSSK